MARKIGSSRSEVWGFQSPSLEQLPESAELSQ